jgi:hypothetical protein
VVQTLHGRCAPSTFSTGGDARVGHQPGRDLDIRTGNGRTVEPVSPSDRTPWMEAVPGWWWVAGDLVASDRFNLHALSQLVRGAIAVADYGC